MLLGNYTRDPDRFEAMDTLFQEFLKEAGVRVQPQGEGSEAAQSHQKLLAEAEQLRQDIVSLEEQRETLAEEIGPRRRAAE